MARSLYIHEEQNDNPSIRRIMIILLLLALLTALAVGGFLYLNGLKSDKIVDDFTLAMSEDRFGDAVILYRQAQEKALANGPLDRNQAQYAQAVAAMEEQTASALAAMEQKLLSGETLSKRELSLAEDLSELSASRLAGWLRGLCRDYLFGQLERPVLEQAFSQLAGLANLKQTVQNLPAEFDRLMAAQPKMIEANTDLAAGAYWPAYALYQTLAGDASLTGFVRDQTLLQISQCKTQMYDPLLSEAKTLMEGGRYLSAQKALTEMIAVFPDDQTLKDALNTCNENSPKQLAAYSGAIEFLTIKPLIVNPAEAFDGDSYSAAAADSMLTAGEFQAMLEQLYANQYILIDSSRIYNDQRQLQTLSLPPDKKPLVLVIEGLNYYATRRKTGNAWNLALDEGGEVCAEYPGAGGQMILDRRGEAIGILDEFVAAHPDFSLDGAKGTISLTGYECIFGLVTDADQLEDRNKALQDNGMSPENMSDTDITANRAQAQAIIDRLKGSGWLFASSTYGFIDARSQNLERIQADTEKWLSQVGSLTGPVSMLNYPNGSFIQGSDERAQYLKSKGFILFAGIGTTAYLYAGDQYIYIDKTPVNGFTLSNSQTYQLNRFFDVAAVYDAAARNP